MALDWNAEFPWMTADLGRVKHMMRQSLGGRDGKPHTASEKLVERPGHLFRPKLTLLVGYLHCEGPASEETIKAAAAVELLHVAALYHDDVIDEAATRRDEETLNTRYGDKTAILSGDYLLSCCMSLVASLGPAETATMARALREICHGQLLEMADTYNMHRTKESYFFAITGKTASLLSTSVALGAEVMNSPENIKRLLATYVEELGLAFQINDDIQDIRPGVDTTGKSVGRDLQNGVYTLPVICGMKCVPEELGELFSAPRLTAARQDSIHVLLERSGSLAEAAGIARHHVNSAYTQLDLLEREWEATRLRERLSGIAELLIPELGTADPRSQSA